MDTNPIQRISLSLSLDRKYLRNGFVGSRSSQRWGGSGNDNVIYTDWRERWIDSLGDLGEVSDLNIKYNENL